MLEVFAKLIIAILISYGGFYVIKSIIKSNTNFFTIRNSILILILSIITVIMHKAKYTGIESFIIFLLNIVIYKIIFKNKIEESIIAVGMMMLIMFISDAIGSIFLKLFFSIEDIRKIWILNLVGNGLITIIECLIVRIDVIKKQLQKFYCYFEKRSSLLNICFFILIIIGFCIFTYNSGIFFKNWNITYILNITLIIILGLIAYIFIKSRNSFNELTDEYDNLFSYVQNFEDWIEKEQLNRHEYKNQLAVLYCLTKEKKVKSKIAEILEDNINIDDEVINQLKKLPKGGIKGLMYYKVAIAEKKKIKVTADISIETKSLLKKLSEKNLRIVCKLIGIYLDNAIEAAEETRKKRLLIEVYELPNKVCFVFSNTFKMQANFAERNNKGISSKGEGRGNGLYFASKLIKLNDWLETKQEIIDNYYIQQLIIKKEL